MTYIGNNGKGTKRTMAYRETWEWNPENLESLIAASQISVEGIAQASGVSQQSIHNYCNKRSTPGTDALIKLADYFAVPLDYLTGRCDEDIARAVMAHYPAYFQKLRRAPWEVYLTGRRNIPDAYIGYGYESPWPYSLLDDIICNRNRTDEEDFWTNVLTDDQEAGLEKAISTLTEREQTALNLYYKEGLTLREAGESLGVTQERFRQILAKAVRKLRHPLRFKMIRFGAEGIAMQNEAVQRKIALDAEMVRLDELERELNERRERLGLLEDETNEAAADAQEGAKDIRNFPIDEMELSVRSFNCLKRAGVNTLGQLVEKIESGDVIRIRNLGRKSLEELVHTVKVITGEDYGSLYWYGRFLPKSDVGATQ